MLTPSRQKRAPQADDDEEAFKEAVVLDKENAMNRGVKRKQSAASDDYDDDDLSHIPPYNAHTHTLFYHNLLQPPLPPCPTTYHNSNSSPSTPPLQLEAYIQPRHSSHFTQPNLDDSATGTSTRSITV